MRYPLFGLPRDDIDSCVSAVGASWLALRDKRIFVTGGTGFFGKWIVESFVAANERFSLGAEMVVLSRSPEAFIARYPSFLRQPGLSLWSGDVRSFSTPIGKFDFVIHGATEADAKLNKEQPALMFDTIVTGTRQVLSFCESAGTRSLLILSSGACYGQQPAGVNAVEEGMNFGVDPRNPGSAYAVGKLAAEHMAAVYGRKNGCSIKIARCFSFFGPFLPLDSHFAIGNFLRDAMLFRPIEIRGDGAAMRSYLYASDLCTWLWKILLEGRPGSLFNVGSDRGVSIKELAAIVNMVIRGGEGVVEIRGSEITPGQLSRYLPSNEHVKNVLQVAERVPLEDGLRRWAEWLSEKSFDQNS